MEQMTPDTISFRDALEDDWSNRDEASHRLVEVSCTDDGHGMKNATSINDDFLCIGGSNKADESAGGFGVAKVVICAGIGFWLHTNANYLDWEYLREGATIEEDVDDIHGTSIRTMVLEEVPYSSTRWEWYDFVRALELNRASGIRVTAKRIAPDGSVMQTKEIAPIRIGRELDDLGWCKISSNASRANSHRGVHVRVRGCYQFTIDLADDVCVFVDIDDPVKPPEAGYPFNLSREGLLDEYWKQIRTVVHRCIIEPNRVNEPAPPVETIEIVNGRQLEEKPEPIIGGVNDTNAESRSSSITWSPEVEVYTKDHGFGQRSGVEDTPTSFVGVEAAFRAVEYEGPPISPFVDFPFIVKKVGKRASEKPEKQRVRMHLLSKWRAVIKVILEALGSDAALDDGVLVGLNLDEDREVLASYSEREAEGKRRHCVLIAPRKIKVSSPIPLQMTLLLSRACEEIQHLRFSLGLGKNLHSEEFHCNVTWLFEHMMSNYYRELCNAVRDAADELNE